MTEARNNPRLWKKVVDEIKSGTKGGIAGKWNARKAQLAVLEYKRRGGTYTTSTPKKDNSLHKWTKQDWQYIPGTDRYLPVEVIKSLSQQDKKNEAKLKNGKIGKKVPWSKSVSEKMKKIL